MVISDDEDDDVKDAMSTGACPVIMAQYMFLFRSPEVAATSSRTHHRRRTGDY